MSQPEFLQEVPYDRNERLFGEFRAHYKLEKHDLSPIPSTFGDLDEALGGGFARGGLCVLAAHPDEDMTGLALSIARRSSMLLPALYVSTTLTRPELALRNLAGTALVDFERTWAKDLTEPELDALQDALRDVKHMQFLTLRSASHLDLAGLRKLLTAERKTQGGGLGVVVVDGLQGMTDFPETYTWQDEAHLPGQEVMAPLRRLALEFGVALLTVYRLPRAPRRTLDWRRVPWGVEVKAVLDLQPFGAGQEQNLRFPEHAPQPEARLRQLRLWTWKGADPQTIELQWWPGSGTFHELGREIGRVSDLMS